MPRTLAKDRKKRTKRKLAPANFEAINLGAVNEREGIVKRYMDTLTPAQQKKVHTFFGDPGLQKQYEATGYKPCLIDGDQLHHKGDPLLWIEQEKFDRHMQSSEARSRKIMEDSIRGEGKDTKVRDQDGKVHGLVEVQD